MRRAGKFAAVAVALGVVALAAALGAGVWRYVAGFAHDTREDEDAKAQESAKALPASAAQSPAVDVIADPLASTSLRDTAADGDVRFDADGALVLDLALRRYFDYHLSLIGERDLDQIRALMRRSLAARFDPARVAVTMAHFDRYAAYLHALSDSAIAAQTDPAQRLEAVRRLRRETLGDPMARAFFAEEEALAELSLRRLRIAADPALSVERKREALAALDRDTGYAARDAATLSELAAEQNAQFEAMRAPAQQRRAEREAAWGVEAAQRLEALDAERAAWDARLRDYIAARERIAHDPRLSASARAQAIADLRARAFTAPEQRRVASLEAIGQLEAALGSH